MQCSHLTPSSVALRCVALLCICACTATANTKVRSRDRGHEEVVRNLCSSVCPGVRPAYTSGPRRRHARCIGLLQCMRATPKLVSESQLAAIFAYECAMRGSTQLAYPCECALPTLRFVVNSAGSGPVGHCSAVHSSSGGSIRMPRAGGSALALQSGPHCACRCCGRPRAHAALPE